MLLHLEDCLLEELLHESAETLVQRVRHGVSGERYVVKMVVPGVAQQRAIGRLVHEHQLLSRLSDVPGIIRVKGFEHHAEQAVLWLEDQGLQSLDHLLTQWSRLPLRRALRLGLELSKVLDRIHARGVVHKDIKPQNILWDEAQEHLTLLDFAIASELVEEATNAAIPEALEGTLAYISPEQTGRMARGVDTRADLYSLGIVLFELLFGRRPFIETDPLALVHAHLARRVPALEKLVPGLPPIVARLVEHCLEKHPEKRYQTAKGLAHDICQCLEQLDEHGFIAPFDLGQKDFSPLLHIPQLLIGRTQEAAEIRSAFDRAAEGAVELLLVNGPSGVGKTALVRSVYQEMAKIGRGLLLSGKHDQLGRSVPYAALAQAFGGLMRELASSPKQVFETWKARFEKALGPLSRVIADIVPEMEWLMGTLPAVPVVPTEMTYNRLKLAWIEFVRAIADASPPLALFLDDMQWIDPASLELLKTLLTDAGKKNLLVIAAYRDNEVEDGHPLWNLVESVKKTGVDTPRITVGLLGERSIQDWLGVALSTSPAQVKPLAAALHTKTQGNPFFLGQLLLELHRQKRIQRNLETGEWEWDQNAVEHAAVTDNVVELMSQKVAELPLSTQVLLGQAACAGHSFSLAELAILAGMEPTRIAQELHPALLAGLVIPLDGQYREAQALAQAAEPVRIEAGYRFLHDRVQQAFYEQMLPSQRIRTHGLIGQRLRTLFEQEGGSNQKLLELVRHLNLSADLLSTEAERQDLARLNLRAAKAAKINGSYRLQTTLVEQAQSLLGQTAWQQEPALAVELALERIEADFMLREFESVHRRAEALLALPLSPLPRLAAQELRVRTCLASGQYQEGERLGLAALAERGVTYPPTNEACIAEAIQLLKDCDNWFDQHPQGFSSMTVDSSREHLLSDAIEAAIGLCSAFGNRPAHSMISSSRCVKLAMQSTLLTPVTPFFIGSFGYLKSAMSGDHRQSVRWAREGAHVAARIGSPLLPECMTFQALYVAYEFHVEQSRRYYEACVQAARASGSFQGTSWGLSSELSYAYLWGGHPLNEVAEKEHRQRDIMARSGDALGTHASVLTRNYVAFLRKADSPRSVQNEWLDTGSRFFRGAGVGFVAQRARILEAHLFLMFGEWSRALERAEEAERFRPAIYGAPIVTDIPLWRGLAAAKCYSKSLPESERSALLLKLEQAIERFRYFSEGCKENFLHKLRILEAERARVQEKTDEAMANYDDAIDLARKEGFLHIEALAAHFCAEFYLERNRKRNAALYLQAARDAYLRWDAAGPITFLEKKYSDLLTASTSTVRPSHHTTSRASYRTTGNDAIDPHAAIRTTQALSSELNLDRLINRLMELCLTHAAVQQGALFFAEKDELVLVARLAAQNSQIDTGLSTPLGQCYDIPVSVIQYVVRSREPVVINDLSSEKRFLDDAYLSTQTVRSILTLPLIYKNRLYGVLYLEHRDTPSIFPPSRVDFLSLVASQAAIAIENALAYSDLKAKVQTLESKNS